MMLEIKIVADGPFYFKGSFTYIDDVTKALSKFKGVKRRLEKKGVFAGVHVFDDFAHHPTAIKHTIEGLKALVGSARLIVALEFRSNSMKHGSHSETLKASLEGADEIHLLIPMGMNWDPREYFSELEHRVYFYESIEDLAKNMADNAKNNDHILIMSNGDFGGLNRLLIQSLKSKLPGRT